MERSRSTDRRKSVSTSSLQARDVMTSNPVSVRPTCTLQALVGLLLENGTDSVPVVDLYDRLLGVASLSDLLGDLDQRHVERTEASQAFQPSQPLQRPLPHEPALPGIRFLELSHQRATVAEVIRPHAASAQPETPLSRIAELLLESTIDQVFILDDRKLVGVVTRLDVMRALVHPARLRRRTNGANRPPQDRGDTETKSCSI